MMTLDNANYSELARAMGMNADAGNDREKASTLARLRINHQPIMGLEEIRGKKVNVEVVPAGTYKVQVPDGPEYFATSITIRPYLQRFMYKRFVKGSGEQPNKYIKTVMHDDLNVDLKDSDGGFNCGKPAGYIQDFKALPKNTQDLIKTIKRVRVLFGTATLNDAMDDKGSSVETSEIPFIWEIENRDAYKEVGTIFSKLAKHRRLPLQHNFLATTEERSMASGSVFFLPKVELNMSDTLDMGQEEQTTFADFLAWVNNYNDYIVNQYNTKAIEKHADDEDDDDFSDIIDMEDDEVAQ